MGGGHKRNNFMPMAAIQTSAAAAFVQHAVEDQLVYLPWYHARNLINLKPFLPHILRQDKRLDQI